VVLPNHDSARALVIPARHLVRDLRQGGEMSAANAALEPANAGRPHR
jgi:hypothetical protein